jgi:hypothetical protein
MRGRMPVAVDVVVSGGASVGPLAIAACSGDHWEDSMSAIVP